MGDIIFHPFITAPLLLFALAFIKPKSKFSVLLNLLVVGIYIFILYKVVLWPDYGSYYLRYFYVLLFITTCIKPIRSIKDLPVFSMRFWLWLPKVLVLAFLLFVLSEVITTTSTKNVSTIELTFPLKNGEYYVHQGGSSPITNYHSGFLDKHAYDFDKLNKWGRSWNNSLFRSNDLNDYNIFKDTVYSPCNGIIVAVAENFYDHNIGKLDDFKDSANRIVIRTGSYNVFLLHLLNNSIVVNIGDSVIIGQPLAMVGNSGRSKNPHLHIHAILRKKMPFEEKALILFNGKTLPRNTIIQSYSQNDF